MRPTCCLLWLLLCIGSVSIGSVMASETNSPLPSAARPVQNAVGDAEDQEIRDPFAKEEEAGKKTAVSDPLEAVNRACFRFNDKLYFWVLKPVATGYNKVAPEPFRQSVKRFFINARYPVRVVNNLLQAKFKGAGEETARFVINSTVGIGGLFDPAEDEWRLRPHSEDLDQTLGFYGVPSGWYLTLPLLGPSSLRGTAGMLGDSFLIPWNYVDDLALLYGSRAFDTLNSTSLSLGEYESFIKSSFDPYVAVRDAYTSNRRSLVNQ